MRYCGEVYADPDKGESKDSTTLAAYFYEADATSTDHILLTKSNIIMGCDQARISHRASRLYGRELKRTRDTRLFRRSSRRAENLLLIFFVRSQFPSFQVLTCAFGPSSLPICIMPGRWSVSPRAISGQVDFGNTFSTLQYSIALRFVPYFMLTGNLAKRKPSWFQISCMRADGARNLLTPSFCLAFREALPCLEPTACADSRSSLAPPRFRPRALHTTSQDFAHTWLLHYSRELKKDNQDNEALYQGEIYNTGDMTPASRFVLRPRLEILHFHPKIL